MSRTVVALLCVTRSAFAFLSPQRLRPAFVPTGHARARAMARASTTLPRDSPATPAWTWTTAQGVEYSPQDDRSYRVLRLANGLRAIVVSDPDADKAAGALSVDVGAARDPEEFVGLAHFCEHMLFLGSERFPAENHYKKLLARHGGRSNASTSLERTLYKFEIVASARRG